METKDYVTLIGIALTFLVGVTSIIVTIKNAKKTMFINAITNSRIKYIQELRIAIAKFCWLCDGYQNKKTDEILEKINECKYQIKLYLNPEYKEWDGEILKLIEEIPEGAEGAEEAKKKIDRLILITQFTLKLEWEGAKREGGQGTLSNIEKVEMRNEYYKQYQKHLSK